MKPSEQFLKYRVQIREIVEANRASNPRVFGSVLTGNDSDESDLDILVDPTDETTLFDISAIQYELNELLGIQVDVHTPMSIPESFRESIVSVAKAV